MQLLTEAFNCCLKGEYEQSKLILDSLDQNDLRVCYNLGWHHLRTGNLRQGFECFNAGRWLECFGSPVPQWQKISKNVPIYRNEILTGKTLLFNGEGGLGDEINNIRFAEYFAQKGAKIIASCHPSLFCIFRKIPYITALISYDYSYAVDCDYWVPAMSAPSVLNFEYKDLNGAPYLNFFDKRPLDGKINTLKVGLRWAGNPEFEHDLHRILPIKEIFKLARTEGATFYSLQRDTELAESRYIIDLSKELKTWQDTAEIINSLDLVITSCTSVAHLAGALGKPTWIIVPILPYYTWALPGNKSPWYNSVTLYRQTKFQDWTEPFNKVKSDLVSFIKDRTNFENQPPA
jgi:hypothetical protein